MLLLKALLFIKNKINVKPESAIILGSGLGDFTDFLEKDITEVREKLGIDPELLKCYYCAEKKLFPNSKESQRL